MATKLWVGGASGAANSASTAANWSPSGVPTSSDSVVFDGAVSVVDCTAGLDQSAYTYVSLTVYDSYTGKIGTATAPYQCGATLAHLHKPSGVQNAAGSTRLNFNFGSAQTALQISGSATSSADTGLPTIRVKGTNASNAIYISGGALVGLAAASDSEAATAVLVNTSANSAGASPTLTLGSGCTLTSVNMSAGTILNRGSAVTTLTMQAGTYTVNGSPAHTTIEVQGGTVYYNSSGTITTLLIGNNGTADFSRDPRAKTVTNITMHSGATLNLDNGVVRSITITNGIDLLNCALQDVSILTWADNNIPNFVAP